MKGRSRDNRAIIINAYVCVLVVRVGEWVSCRIHETRQTDSSIEHERQTDWIDDASIWTKYMPSRSIEAPMRAKRPSKGFMRSCQSHYNRLMRSILQPTDWNTFLISVDDLPSTEWWFPSWNREAGRYSYLIFWWCQCQCHRKCINQLQSTQWNSLKMCIVMIQMSEWAAHGEVNWQSRQIIWRFLTFGRCFDN